MNSFKLVAGSLIDVEFQKPGSVMVFYVSELIGRHGNRYLSCSIESMPLEIYEEVAAEHNWPANPVFS